MEPSSSHRLRVFRSIAHSAPAMITGTATASTSNGCACVPRRRAAPSSGLMLARVAATDMGVKLVVSCDEAPSRYSREGSDGDACRRAAAAAQRPERIMPAPTVSFVVSSIKMKLPVVRLRA